MIASVLLSVATVIGDFTSPDRAWTPNGHVRDAVRSSRGLSYRIVGNDPQLVSPVLVLPVAPEGATRAVFILEGDAEKASAEMFWAAEKEGFSPQRERQFKRVSPTGWKLEMPIGEYIRGKARLRLDVGDERKCPQASVRRLLVDFKKPVWRGKGKLPAPDTWAPGVAPLVLSRDNLRFEHSRTRMGIFRFLAGDKVWAEGHGDERLVIVGGDGRPETLALRDAQFTCAARGAVRTALSGPGVTAAATLTDGAGRTWTIVREFSLTDAGVGIVTKVSCDRPADVLHLPYLTLFVDRASKGHKAQAMLPGLEYLADEPSSNEKEIRGEGANRLMPSVDRLCYPLMLLTDGTGFCALRWKQPAGGVQPFTPVFDTPDRQFASGGHLFALWAPAAGACRYESEWDVYEPLANFESGCLEAELVVGKGGTVAAALERLLPASSLPEPPALDPEAAMELLAHGWLDSGCREGTRFRHAIGSPHFPARTVVDAPTYVKYLADRMKNGELAKRLRQLYDETIASFAGKGESRGVGGSVSHVVRPAAPLVWGDPHAFAAGQLGVARSSGQRLAEGFLTYVPADGKPNFAETLGAGDCNGYTAMTASGMAAAATWISDEQVISNVVAATDRILARYRGTVPCGAQPWEMPLHCPDIVASAHLVRLCATAWLLTGDRRYLDEGRSWAYTGLTMVYLEPPAVATPGFCGLYATIGVMGATHWVSPNWMGRPVQWCGLVYAHALSEFADALGTGPDARYWRTVAKGITASGVDQTYPMSQPYEQGLLPDSTQMATQERIYVPINPGTVQGNLAYFAGRRFYQVIRARTEPGAAPLVHVAGDAEALPPDDGDILRVRVSPWSKDPSKICITRVRKPSQVTVDGNPVPFECKAATLVLTVPPGASICVVR